MRFESEALRDSCFYGRRINSFYVCVYVCMYWLVMITRLLQQRLSHCYQAVAVLIVAPATRQCMDLGATSQLRTEFCDSAVWFLNVFLSFCLSCQFCFLSHCSQSNYAILCLHTEQVWLYCMVVRVLHSRWGPEFSSRPCSDRRTWAARARLCHQAVNFGTKA